MSRLALKFAALSILAFLTSCTGGLCPLNQPVCWMGGGIGGGGGGGSGITLIPAFVLDAAFNKARGPDRTVNVIVPSSDGTSRVYVGGVFISFEMQSSPSLARVMANGTVDTTFSVGTGFNGAVNAIAEMQDGSFRIYVAGSFTSYNGTAAGGSVRLLPNGSLDPTFVTGTGFDVAVSKFFFSGYYQTNTVNTLALAATGDLYVGGKFTTYNGTPSGNIIRLNADGSIDAGFATGSGFSGPPIFPQVAVILPKPATTDVYVFGTFDTYNGGAVPSGAVLLTDTGAINGVFNAGAGVNGTILAAAIEPLNGRIYLGGYFNTFGGTSARALVEIDATGAVFEDFGVGLQNGGYLTPFVHTILIDGSGRIYLGGVFETLDVTATPHGMVRLTSGNAVDATFLATIGVGRGTYYNASFVVGSALADDGDLYFGGIFDSYSTAGVSNFMKLSPLGELRSTVNSGMGIGAYPTGAQHIILDPGSAPGDIIINVNHQSATYNGEQTGSVYRLTASANLGAGQQVVVSDANGVGANVNALLGPTDGSTDFYVAGNFNDVNGTSRFNIARINNNMTVDGGFASGFATTCGINLVTGCPNVQVLVSVGDGSGDIFMGGGFSGYAGQPINHFTRIHADGSWANTFNTGTGPNVSLSSIAAPGDGTAFIAGPFTQYNGNLVNGVAHILANGSFDATFGSSGSGPVGGFVSLVALAPSQTRIVYVGGNFTSFNGIARKGMVRLDANGNVDTAFDAGLDLPGVTPLKVSLIQPVNDGSDDIYVSGTFISAHGQAVGSLLRLDRSGNVITNFPLGPGFINSVTSMVPVPGGNGALYVGGAFTTYGGNTVYGIARLLPP